MHRPTFAACVLSLSLVGLAAPARAQAPDDPSQRYPVWGAAVKTAVQMAGRHWGMNACGGQVNLGWGRLDTSLNAQSRWQNPKSSYGDPQENTDCVVVLNTAVQFDWPRLCTIVVHEYGHLTGHPHVDDQNDVMNPYYTGPVAECAATPEPRGAPSRHGGHVGGVAVAVACPAAPRPGKRRAKSAARRRPVHGLQACRLSARRS